MKFLALASALAGTLLLSGNQEQDRIANILKSPPKTTTMTISYHPIAHLENQSRWHIGDSRWWVRLQPVDIYSMKNLETRRRYKVTGVVLDQGYGCVNVWVKKLEYAD
jgi:hypothetical protein